MKHRWLSVPVVLCLCRMKRRTSPLSQHKVIPRSPNQLSVKSFHRIKAHIEASLPCDGKVYFIWSKSYCLNEPSSPSTCHHKTCWMLWAAQLQLCVRWSGRSPRPRVSIYHTWSLSRLVLSSYDLYLHVHRELRTIQPGRGYPADINQSQAQRRASRACRIDSSVPRHDTVWLNGPPITKHHQPISHYHRKSHQELWGCSGSRYGVPSSYYQGSWDQRCRNLEWQVSFEFVLFPSSQSLFTQVFNMCCPVRFSSECALVRNPIVPLSPCQMRICSRMIATQARPLSFIKKSRSPPIIWARLLAFTVQAENLRQPRSSSQASYSSFWAMSLFLLIFFAWNLATTLNETPQVVSSTSDVSQAALGEFIILFVWNVALLSQLWVFFC